MRGTLEYVTLTRELAAQHAEALAALGRDNAWENWRSENVLMELPDKWRLSLLALSRGGPAAYAVVSRKLDAAHIHHLIVGASGRRQGIGKRMLLEIASTCVREGIGRITLKVSTSNQSAVAFYERWGFRVTAAKGTDLLEMSAHVQTLLAALGSARPQENGAAASAEETPG